MMNHAGWVFVLALLIVPGVALANGSHACRVALSSKDSAIRALATRLARSANLETRFKATAMTQIQIEIIALRNTYGADVVAEIAALATRIQKAQNTVQETDKAAETQARANERERYLRWNQFTELPALSALDTPFDKDLFSQIENKLYVNPKGRLITIDLNNLEATPAIREVPGLLENSARLSIDRKTLSIRAGPPGTKVLPRHILNLHTGEVSAPLLVDYRDLVGVLDNGRLLFTGSNSLETQVPGAQPVIHQNLPVLGSGTLSLEPLQGTPYAIIENETRGRVTRLLNTVTLEYRELPNRKISTTAHAPGSDFLYYSVLSHSDGEPGIYKLQLSTGKESRLPIMTDGASGLVISPDSQRLLHLNRIPSISHDEHGSVTGLSIFDLSNNQTIPISEIEPMTSVRVLGQQMDGPWVLIRGRISNPADDTQLRYRYYLIDLRSREAVEAPHLSYLTFDQAFFATGRDELFVQDWRTKSVYVLRSGSLPAGEK